MKKIVNTGSAFDVLILAPFGHDAKAAQEVLRSADIQSHIVSTMTELCDHLQNDAGAVLIAEEGLTAENIQDLNFVLSKQEPWSNLPILLMTSQKERLLKTEQILEIFGLTSAISILERPFRIITLVSAVRVALQTREKQYQVQELLKQQSLALQQRDEFLSIASHELRTPITSLKLQIQMRKRRMEKDNTPLSPQDVSSLIEKTETQLNRLTHLVDDMLDISRIINGKLSLNLQRFDLGELVDEVSEAFMPQFQAAGCAFKLAEKSQIEGHWDRYRIEQVIVNLFTNAIKYGSGKPIYVSVKTHSRFALISVKDHGVGIAPEDYERIFQRFERVGHNESIGGLGLGLFITRQILDQHGGSITVQSQLGEGSTFQVSLPVSV